MARVKRVKPQRIQPLHDLKAVNEALREIGKHQRELSLIEAELNEAVEAAKARAERAAAPGRAAIKALEDSIHAFVEYNRDELFKKRKSVELTYGTIGSRVTHLLKTARRVTWKQVLGRLQEEGLEEAIRVKHDVNKEILEKWEDEALEALGVQRVREDRVFYEVKIEELPAEG